MTTPLIPPPPVPVLDHDIDGPSYRCKNCGLHLNNIVRDRPACDPKRKEKIEAVKKVDAEPVLAVNAIVSGRRYAHPDAMFRTYTGQVIHLDPKSARVLIRTVDGTELYLSTVDDFRVLTRQELESGELPTLAHAEPVKNDRDAFADLSDADTNGAADWKPVGLLPDWMIERDVKIVPFSPQQHRPGVLSYGVSSYGYDVRASYEWKVFSNMNGAVIDPKNFDPKAFWEVKRREPSREHSWKGRQNFESCEFCGVYKDNPYANSEETNKGHGVWPQVCYNKQVELCEPVLIPPNSFALTESLEYLEIPRDVLVVVVGKSTLARCGLIVNVTPLEPEWRGRVTMEISNTTTMPARVYPGEGIAQFLFFRAAAPCQTSYADKKGKYQDQTGGVTLPKV